MRYQQRAVATKAPRRRKSVLWLHEKPAESAWAPELPDFTPRASDRYVTVDERVGFVVGLVAARWPAVTDDGTLEFPGRMDTAWFASADLQQTVDGYRKASGQAERPLRIGDTFWIRGWSEDPAKWRGLVDVTAHARAAVKGAVATLCVGEVEDPDAMFQVDETEQESIAPPAYTTEQVPPAAGANVASPTV
jgi:hypothetical protein